MLENEVVTAYNQWQAIQNQRANRDTSILADFNVLGSRLAQNYQQGRITLLEFLDYYSTLHTLIATEADFRHRWLTTREALNFAVGQRILP
jgi:outer membrane protein TolC